ncbi:uncharacterized protein LTR77_000340 [Saxophila tyrrhenica]|uniref:Zn(2)-C6 fungal-type domain-containing protein n=1 Tax=Saxophila tyrrhenica TaxID=1690608 RepID=A0AAV9PPJ9_9PEZI|nr:hypothetical protein LTR77_000340 [Saxophila tyrrhenica]
MMTSTILAATQQPPDPALGRMAGPPPKKKRKRAGTGGANDDCFACSTRGAKCDRKRPYCTQCIEIGKECSGYKTTLTWGVGVASRGKLRGLTCPIANKNADGTDVSAVELEARRRRKSSTSQIKRENGTKRPASPGSYAGGARDTETTADFGEGLKATQTYPFPNGPSAGWQSLAGESSIWQRRTDDIRHQSANLRLPSIQTGFDAPIDPLKSAQSMSSYSDAAFYSPVEYPHTPSSLAFPEPLTHSMSAPFPDSASTMNADHYHASGSTATETFPGSAQSQAEFAQSQSGFTANGAVHEQATLELLPGVFYDGSTDVPTPISTITFNPLGSELDGEADDIEDIKAEDDNNQVSVIDARFSSPFFQVSPRLRQLINYYDRHICPFLVTFDNTENPYRKHILQFALQNEGLQHAIAALATNNFRMRTKELRQKPGHVEELDDNIFNPNFTLDPSGPTQEESCYKQMSINHLNMRLADNRSAQDDSVLATLLILCLFHVCDSGFSKFKTQLAGVQKLLSLRHPNTQSEFTRWVEMFFTWFDVMTSTVNDREVQIKGDSLAMLDFNANLGAMEHFSGCDGRLFKLIARLGRLNLLAQGRPVRASNSGAQTPRPTNWWRKPSPSRISSLLPSDYANMDGNGWGAPILPPTSPEPEADPSLDRSDFWSEWHTTRSRLETWTHPPHPPSTTSPLDQADLYHINESFRLAALLYTERLGSPLLPSSAPPFQNLVTRGLTHIASLRVTSCVNKFLLWPLFIIGTESVDEGHREIIRVRCKDVAEESGFFNNMNTLFVLERVWMEVGSNVMGMEAEEVRARRRDSEAGEGQAFRWRKAMDRVDGEYIVI